MERATGSEWVGRPAAPLSGLAQKRIISGWGQRFFFLESDGTLAGERIQHKCFRFSGVLQGIPLPTAKKCLRNGSKVKGV